MIEVFCSFREHSFPCNACAIAKLLKRGGVRFCRRVARPRIHESREADSRKRKVTIEEVFFNSGKEWPGYRPDKES
jgi:hypothetical protein